MSEVSASKLVVQRLRKSFQSQRSTEPIPVFDDISFDVRPSEFISLVGPSGCGKTTFLRILDGLIPRDDGTILLDGKAVIKPGPDKGFVFQDSSLLSWPTKKWYKICGLSIIMRRRVSKVWKRSLIWKSKTKGWINLIRRSTSSTTAIARRRSSVWGNNSSRQSACTGRQAKSFASIRATTPCSRISMMATKRVIQAITWVMLNCSNQNVNI